jgi:hypothetical protein
MAGRTQVLARATVRSCQPLIAASTKSCIARLRFAFATIESKAGVPACVVTSSCQLRSIDRRPPCVGRRRRSCRHTQAKLWKGRTGRRRTATGILAIMYAMRSQAMGLRAYGVLKRQYHELDGGRERNPQWRAGPRPLHAPAAPWIGRAGGPLAGPRGGNWEVGF